jgi:sugar lactone lactonase YvrE
MTGISFGEQPRWHENRLWFSDWGAREVIAVDLDGNSEVILRAPSFPCCVDWLPDGRLLLVSARDGLLLRREPDGTLVTHGDLNRVSKPAAGNELVVDGRGNAYVNGGGFDLMAGEPFAPGIVALVTLDGPARQVADGLAFPNGMLVTADDATLIVGESYAKRIPAFDIAVDGSLSRGPILAMASPTVSASTPRVPSGTRTFPTNVACAFAKVVKCYRGLSLTAAASPARSEVPTGAPYS